MNVQQPQQGCMMQQHMNSNGGNSLQTSCGCFHLQCTANNNSMMNNNQLQTIPMSVERRLMQLEGDKDTLQLQVYFMDNISRCLTNIVLDSLCLCLDDAIRNTFLGCRTF